HTTNLTIANIDWNQFTPTFTTQRPAPLLTDLPENHKPQTTSGATTPLVDELTGATMAQQLQVLLQHVRVQAAVTLGLSSHDAVTPDKPFQELGFDSLTAVQLRNQLNRTTGLQLPTTLIFDHPTPTELADYLRGQLADEGSISEVGILAELDRWAAAYAAGEVGDEARGRIATRMRALLTNWADAGNGTDHAASHHDLEKATADDLFDLISREFGKS
nr:phosphopantetheine-binding protein [Micromonospora sp. DSM 115978]